MVSRDLIPSVLSTFVQPSFSFVFHSFLADLTHAERHDSLLEEWLGCGAVSDGSFDVQACREKGQNDTKILLAGFLSFSFPTSLVM